MPLFSPFLLLLLICIPTATSLSFSSLGFSRTDLKWPTLGHASKTLILGLASNIFDVYSDFGTGLYYLEEKNVTRSFSRNETIPTNCLPFNNTISTEHCFNTTCDNDTVEGFICQEQDVWWAAVTFSFIQAPSVVIWICVTCGLIIFFRHNCRTVCKYVLLPSLILIVPFPLIVFLQQIASLLMNTEHMEYLSALLLYGEGGLEASPQLLLLIYIIMSDSERQVAMIQKASLISSAITITKTSVELFSAESMVRPSQVIGQGSGTRGYNDSILKYHKLLGKIWMLVKVSPAFILSLVFKVGTLSIIFTLTKEYSTVYILFGILLTFGVALRLPQPSNCGAAELMYTVPMALFYSLTNVTIVSKCPLNTRKNNFKLMLSVSVAWVLLHMLALMTLVTWVSLPSAYHLDHWHNTNKLGLLAHLPTFYGICVGLFVLGPVSILALLWLRQQVEGIELGKDKFGRKLWNINYWEDVNEPYGCNNEKKFENCIFQSLNNQRVFGVDQKDTEIESNNDEIEDEGVKLNSINQDEANEEEHSIQ